jgi:monoterpene epsilon-lactone hydrolase
MALPGPSLQARVMAGSARLGMPPVIAGSKRLRLLPSSSSQPVHPVGISALRLLLELGLSAPPFRAPIGTSVTSVRAPFDGGRVVGEWVRARGVERSDAAVLYIHGSGYVVCSPRTHRGLTARLSALTGLPVFSLDYRLSPRYRFPAAADDALRAYRWLLDHGVDASRIVVAGDSAGGHLTLGLPNDAKRAGLPGPSGLVAFSPLVDTSLRLSSSHAKAVRDPYVPSGTARALVGLHFVGADPADPRHALLQADVRGYPPTLIQAGGLEFLGADATAFADHLEAHGGDCELQLWPGQMHVFQLMHAVLPEARAALDHVAAFVARRIGEGTVLAGRSGAAQTAPSIA